VSWKWNQSCVAHRNKPSHRARVMRMAAAWMAAQDPSAPLTRKVKDVLHWDYDWKPYTPEDLLTIYEEPADEALRLALLECGYSPHEAFTRSSICQERKEQEYALKAGNHYRTRRSWRGPTHGDALHVTHNARKRKAEYYLDTYSYRVQNLPPTSYKGINAE